MRYYDKHTGKLDIVDNTTTRGATLGIGEGPAPATVLGFCCCRIIWVVDPIGAARLWREGGAAVGINPQKICERVKGNVYKLGRRSDSDLLIKS